LYMPSYDSWKYFSFLIIFLTVLLYCFSSYVKKEKNLFFFSCVVVLFFLLDQHNHPKSQLNLFLLLTDIVSMHRNDFRLFEKKNKNSLINQTKKS
jgi:predicted membrane protein